MRLSCVWRGTRSSCSTSSKRLRYSGSILAVSNGFNVRCSPDVPSPAPLSSLPVGMSVLPNPPATASLAPSIGEARPPISAGRPALSLAPTGLTPSAPSLGALFSALFSSPRITSLSVSLGKLLFIFCATTRALRRATLTTSGVFGCASAVFISAIFSAFSACDSAGATVTLPVSSGVINVFFTLAASACARRFSSFLCSLATRASSRARRFSSMCACLFISCCVCAGAACFARSAAMISFGVSVAPTTMPFSLAILRRLLVIIAGTPPASTEASNDAASSVIGVAAGAEVATGAGVGTGAGGCSTGVVGVGAACGVSTGGVGSAMGVVADGAPGASCFSCQLSSSCRSFHLAMSSICCSFSCWSRAASAIFSCSCSSLFCSLTALVATISLASPRFCSCPIVPSGDASAVRYAVS